MTVPTSHCVNVEGIHLRYVDWGGDGPTMLLFHGDMRTSRSWDAVSRRLKDDYRVIALDARGHGDSDWTPQRLPLCRASGRSWLRSASRWVCEILSAWHTRRAAW